VRSVPALAGQAYALADLEFAQLKPPLAVGYRGSRITIGIFRPFAWRWKKSYPG
jgi:hypothetical protein